MVKLVAISISHYVEKVRWALDRAGIPYQEENHIPGFHALPALWLTGGQHRATPILIDGTRVIADSTSILQYLSSNYHQKWLYGAHDALALEERLDRNLGPHVRRYVYHEFFKKGLDLVKVFSQGRLPLLERWVLPAFAPLMKNMMIMDMAVEERPAHLSMESIVTEFNYVTDLLADGRRYLCGESFTAADLAFAALAAPVLLAPEYGAILPKLEDVPAESDLGKLIKHLRETEAGKFALRLYRHERH
jgi:glutathione S-transferase